MYLIAILFLVFALFMLARVPRGYQAIWLGFILLAFGCCIIGLLGYIARFGNYQLEGYLFPLEQPGWTWRLLTYFPPDAFIRFRLWSMMGFVVAVAGFAFSYSVKKWRRTDYLTAVSFLLITACLLWKYDPANLFRLYKAGAELLGAPEFREEWELSLRTMDALSMGAVALILTYSVARILWLTKSSSILQKRAQALGVGIGCGILSVFAIALFALGPAGIFNAYSMATTLLPVIDYPIFDTTYLQALPFAGLAALGAVMLSIFKYGFLGTWRIGSLNLDTQISMANRAIRLALHTFKNRFFAIQAAMNLIVSELEMINDKRLDKIRRQIEWVREICAEVLSHLDVLNIQSGRLQVETTVLSWNEIWREAKYNCAGRLEDITVISDYTGEEVYVWGDRRHLVTVLENLLQNAIDAVKKQVNEPRIQVTTGREYEWSYIRITDNGPGIPKKDLRKIFRPFFSTKPSKTNWGMGLAYCHRVIKAHRGFLNLLTTPGVGTTVEVVLRCVEKIDIPSSSRQKKPFLLRKNPPGVNYLFRR